MTKHFQRRRFLRHTLALAGATALSPVLCAPKVWAGKANGEKRLHLRNLHTEESLCLPYWQDGRYNSEAVQSFNHLLRDHRSGQVTQMDIALLDSVHTLVQTMEADEVQIISGYRSPKTNEKLRQQGRAVAKNSFHIQGRAIDICLAGKDLNTTWQAARKLHGGGVGYYPRSGFIHLDTGRQRYWTQK